MNKIRDILRLILTTSFSDREIGQAVAVSKKRYVATDCWQPSMACNGNRYVRRLPPSWTRFSTRKLAN